jgi:DNA-binding transcriptional ArsR family regulator
MAARIATRRPLAPAAPPTPRVRDFSGGRSAPARIEFDARPVYDFTFSLSADAGSTDDLPPADRHWVETAHAEMRTLFGESFDLYGGELCIVLAGLAVDRPEVRTAAAFVDLISDLDDTTVVRTILGEDLRSPELAPIVERALAGDEAAIEEHARTCDDMQPNKDRARLTGLLFRRPESVLGPARGIMAAWLEHFAPLEERVGEMIERDVAMRAEDRETLAPGDLIERTTGGVRFGSEPGVRRVILAPSYFARPYNYLLAAEDWKLYGYPIADAALDARDPLAPPQAVVRLHRALGDDTRLRILRLLRDRDLYLTEIAQLLELSKPTIKHHLAQLRVAGLVTVIEEAGMTYYSLRRDRLDDASAGLKRFLLD